LRVLLHDVLELLLGFLVFFILNQQAGKAAAQGFIVFEFPDASTENLQSLVVVIHALQNLRLLVRGKAVGLPDDVIEAHMGL